jgi:glycosyltransferase involved in cell wall biosynthesis
LSAAARPAPTWLVGPRPGLRVWAVEPYYGGSHRAFLDGFRAHSGHEIELHTLPGRHWRWRMHGGALRLAELSWSSETRPQVVFASSMLDAPQYLALARRQVSRAPLVLYFHENQLTYPLPQGVERDLGYAFKEVASAGAAERVFFNSAFHRAEFLQALADLLPLLPDEQPTRLIEDLERKSRVLPLGCDLRRFDPYRERGASDRARGRWGDPSRGPLVLWNQRWEYDKAPGDLFRGLYELEREEVPYRLAVAGPNQGLPTAEFVEARDRLAHRLVHWGKIDDFGEYARLLWAADVVVSTARHEFFGLAVTEAIYCGCRPVLPRRLSYPELVPFEAQADTLYDEGDLIGALRRALTGATPWSLDWQRTWVARFDWGSLAQRYDAEVWAVWQRGTSRREGYH